MSWNPSDAQAMVLALALYPKFTAIASVVGSALIIRDVIQVRNNRSDELSTRHRILAGMSACDILSSSALFLTSWPVPEDLPFGLWNVGNKQTCSAQGFFIHLGIGTVIYNACLALYYLLVIRHGWKNEYIAKRVEPWMHFVAVGFALSTGVASLKLNIFNPIGFGYVCTISAYPRFCTQSFENKGPTNCIRGDNAPVYMVFFWLGPACCVILFLAVSLFLVYWKIRTIESNNSRLHGQLQHRFALQSFLYVAAMFTTWAPILGLLIHRVITSKRPNLWVSSSLQGKCESIITKESGRD
jgi:hypothetical protein